MGGSRLKKWISMGFIVFILQLSLQPPSILSASDLHQDYSPLMDWIETEDLETPIRAFGEFEKAFSARIQEENLEYFEKNRALLKRIRDSLDSRELRWRLDRMTQRLVFVPETREPYATLFEDYCRDAVSHVLETTGLENPYRSIETLTSPRPEIPEPGSGIAVYIVHNLARESRSVYIFSNEEERRVKIELKGVRFAAQVGSYSSNIEARQDGTVKITGDTYTVWQNSAGNPYTALMVPVEETLHIALRKHTESAILESLKEDGSFDTETVKQVSDDWIALEEAIVGGCVHVIVPPLLKRLFGGEFPETLVLNDLEQKRSLSRYRLLERGIDVVADLGVRKAIRLYTSNPFAWQSML